MNKKPRKLKIEKLSNEDLATAEKCRDHIASTLYAAGYSQRDITMFLAGSTMLGHLQKGGSSWGRIFLVRKYFTHLDVSDYSLERAGEHDPKLAILPDDPYTI